MIGRFTQEMSCKIAVCQEACGSVRQTQHLYNMEFGINLAPTRRIIYVIHRKFVATGFVADAHDEALAHYGRQVKDYLNQLFSDRWIG